MLAVVDFDRDESIAKLKEDVVQALLSDGDVQEVGLRLWSTAFPTAVFTLKGDKVEHDNYDKGDKLLLEDVLRSLLQQFVTDAVNGGVYALQYQLPGAQQPSTRLLLDLAVWAAKQDLVDHGCPCTLLEELADSVVITELGEVYDYLEPNLMALREANTLKLTVVLRTCNTMQRRLSKSTDVLLRGRISLFMARIYPMMERSGLNVTGLVNTSHSIQVEEVRPGDVDSSGEPVDPQLYSTFWGLQHYFQHMAEVRDADKLAKVLADIVLVLEGFQRRPVTVAAGGPAVLGTGEGGERPTPKYLSSSKLIGLQLRDATLRRTFLVQCLVLLHYLRCPNRPWADPALKPRQLEDLTALEAKVYKALEQTPEDGKTFAAAIREVLAEEAHWVRWKYPLPPALNAPPPQGCQKFERAAVPPLKRRRPDTLARNPALEAAVQLQDNPMEGLRVEERKGLWHSIRDVFADVIEDMEPGIDAEYKRKNEERHSEKVYAWTCYRMLARHSYETYTKSEHQDLEDAAREIFPDVVEKFPKPEPPPKPDATPATPPASAQTPPKKEAPPASAQTTPKKEAPPAKAQ